VNVKCIHTIVRDVLQCVYNNPDTKTKPIGFTRQELQAYVYNLFESKHKQLWDTMRTTDEKYWDKDFGRGVTLSPYALTRDTHTCYFREDSNNKKQKTV
jgi:hypothetical protein